LNDDKSIWFVAYNRKLRFLTFDFDF
jgi:hypothetical protein